VSKPFELAPGAEAFPGYRLHLPIGRGGCGEVWEAVGPEGQSMALKFVRCHDSSMAAREAKSIQAIRPLRHPNLIRVDQVFLQPGYVVIAMELADGSLTDVLDVYQSDYGTSVPGPDAVDFLTQAADAIDFLNTRQHDLDGRRVAFQHCDVKPSNLLLSGNRVKLADFGLSTPMTAGAAPFLRSGTLDFAAPEIFHGQLTDRSDQYALAVSYCLLRGGRLPFPDTPRRFASTYTRPRPDLSMLPAPERAAICRALSNAPYQRWPSCLEMAAELRRMAAPVPTRALA
jgi:serine/threonine protein kinase, bacterial